MSEIATRRGFTLIELLVVIAIMNGLNEELGGPTFAAINSRG
jgi:Tfp pilus assembly protein FimT